jgi:hypothetical protein
MNIPPERADSQTRKGIHRGFFEAGAPNNSASVVPGDSGMDTSQEYLARYDRDERMWRLRRWGRLTVILGCCLAASYFALKEVSGYLASLLVLIGAATVGMGWAKAWPGPEK